MLVSLGPVTEALGIGLHRVGPTPTDEALERVGPTALHLLEVGKAGPDDPT